MLIVSFVSLSVCAGIKGRQTERRNPKTQWLQKERSLCSLQSQSGQSGRAGWLAYIWLLGHLLLLHPVDTVLWCLWFVQGFRGCLTPFLHTKEHVLTECLHSSLTNCKHVELKRCHKNIFMKFAIACVVFEIRLKTKKNMFMHGKQASINKLFALERKALEALDDFLQTCLLISNIVVLKKNIILFIYLLMFGYSGSSLLHGLFSGCSKWKLLSSCMCRLLLLWGTDYNVCGLQ